LYVDRST